MGLTKEKTTIFTKNLSTSRKALVENICQVFSQPIRLENAKYENEHEKESEKDENEHKSQGQNEDEYEVEQEIDSDNESDNWKDIESEENQKIEEGTIRNVGKNEKKGNLEVDEDNRKARRVLLHGQSGCGKTFICHLLSILAENQMMGDIKKVFILNGQELLSLKFDLVCFAHHHP